MSVLYDHEHERKAHTTSRLQRHQQTRNKDCRFATESPWTLWHTGGSWQGHPRYTGARQGTPWVARRNLYEDDHSQTTTRHRPVSRQTCFQGNKCRHALGNLHGSGAGSRNRRSTECCETPLTSRSGDVPNHQEDRTEKRNQSPKRRSTTRPSTSDNVVDVTDVRQEPVSPDVSDAQKELEKETQQVGPPVP